MGKKKTHNMLSQLLDPRFKNLRLVSSFIGWKQVVFMMKISRSIQQDINFLIKDSPNDENLPPKKTLKFLGGFNYQNLRNKSIYY
jgi:hypothetical protein